MLESLHLPQAIYDAVIECDASHHSTKFHRESLLTHLKQCGEMCRELCGLFGIPPEVAYWVGFLHDIGKPLARKPFYSKQTQGLEQNDELSDQRVCRTQGPLKKVNFFGHAQLGACLARHILTSYAPDLIPQEYHNAVLFCIDNHMCCARTSGEASSAFNSYLHLQLTRDHELTIRMLCMLFAADNLSRVSDEMPSRDACVEQSLQLMNNLLSERNEIVSGKVNSVQSVCKHRNCANDKIIVLLLGLSGSGKSTWCSDFVNHLGVPVTVVERDASLFKVANTLSSNSYSSQPISYKEAYDLVERHNAKPLVQRDWVSKLEAALENKETRVILVDTMQTMFAGWQHTLNALSEDAKSTYMNSFKVGLYLIPLQQLGVITESGKTEKEWRLPHADMFYPMINLELGATHLHHIDIGSGWPENVIRWIHKWLHSSTPSNTISSTSSTDPQVTLCELVNLHGFEGMLKLFPQGLLNTSIEYDDEDIQIVTVSYQDGMQIFVGPTRDYRGETLILCKHPIIQKATLLRGSLPVFPDYTSIEKDPQAALFTREAHALAKYVMTYKYDGSLFNMVFLPKDSGLYNIIQRLLTAKKVEWMHSNLPSGLLMYGSKGRFGMNSSNPVKARGRAAIIGSYGSIEAFEQVVETFLLSCNLQHSTLTLHFEAIDKIPSSELTVFYNRAFCPFFGYTVFTNSKKEFFLPDSHSPFHSTPMIVKNTWEEVMQEFKNQRDRLILGDTDLEPEGCVVHIFPQEAGPTNDALYEPLTQGQKRWYPVKLKHDFYYVAHKPNKASNFDFVQELMHNPEYEKLRERLAKCREKPSVESLLLPLTQGQSLVTFELFKSTVEASQTKREMAIFWNQPENKAKTEELQKMCEHVLKEHYPFKKVRVWKWLLDEYPNVLTQQRFIDLI